MHDSTAPSASASGAHASTTLRATRLGRDAGRAPDRDEEMLGHVAIQTSPSSWLPARSSARSATTAWSRGSLIAVFVTLDRTGFPHEQADPAVVEPRVDDARAVGAPLDHHAGVAVLGELLLDHVAARAAPSTSTARIVVPRLVRPHDRVARVEHMDPPPPGLGAVVVDARAVGVRRRGSRRGRRGTRSRRTT